MFLCIEYLNFNQGKRRECNCVKMKGR